MKTIREIIRASGYDGVKEMKPGDNVTVEVEAGPFMPLTVEKLIQKRLSVAHHYILRGDLTCDPEKSSLRSKTGNGDLCGSHSIPTPSSTTRTASTVRHSAGDGM